MANQHEFRLQCAVADYLRRMALPGVYWTALPFGEKRSKATAGRLKRAGVRAGAADFFLLFHGFPVMLELKLATDATLGTKKTYQNADQKATQADFEAAGGRYFLAHGYDEAIAILHRINYVREDRNR